MKHLLIIEDNQELQALLKERFSTENFRLSQAFTGEQGLEIIKSDTPDMILLDLMLPGNETGNSILGFIQSNQKYKHIQVAIFSNLDNPNKTTFSLQNIDYMLKANTPIEDVVSVVKAHLAK